MALPCQETEDQKNKPFEDYDAPDRRNQSKEICQRTIIWVLDIHAIVREVEKQSIEKKTNDLRLTND